MSKIKIHYECELLLAHDLIGGKWKFRILWHIFKGDNRFSILAREIPDITQKVLSVQLKELEESELLVKDIISDKTPKEIRYQINDQYVTIVPVLIAMNDFTKDYAQKNNLIRD